MNKSDFRKKISITLNSNDIDLRFINSWYDGVFEALKNIKEKSKLIKHPRHIGDHLESEVKNVLEKMLPKKFIIEKGFLLNDFSSLSQEQDLLVIDSSLGASICKTDDSGYYPIECALSSIEIKSNLSLSELRKCFVSCASAKKLNSRNFEYHDKEEKRLFYSIFAYSSNVKEGNLLKEINACIKHIPESLRPNLIYILDQGIYFPTHNDQIMLNLESIQKVDEGYKFIPNSTGEYSKPQNLTLFFSMIIEHAFQQSKIRKSVKYSDYSIIPTIWENDIKKSGGDPSIKKHINKFVQWSEDNSTELFYLPEAKCESCKSQYCFYVLPPTSTKERDQIKEKFDTEGFIPLPKNKKHKCSCGNELNIED